MSSSPPDVDAEVIEGCRRGDRDAFRTLYTTYKDRVYSVALHAFAGDAAAACDVTQEVFLKVMTRIHGYRGDSRFSTWLYRVVVNAVSDHRRRTIRRPEGLDPEILEGVPSPHHSNEQVLVRHELSLEVRRAIAMLPIQLRLAVLLRYFEDRSYDDIASAMRCSTGTVASRLNRAHRLLAKHLATVKGLSSST